MASQLKKKARFLKDISQLPKRDRVKYLKDCDECYIHDICEAVANVLINVCTPTTSAQKRKVAALKKQMKKLTHKKTSVSMKRKLLQEPQVGAGIFSIIGTTVLPFLISLLAKKK